MLIIIIIFFKIFQHFLRVSRSNNYKDDTGKFATEINACSSHQSSVKTLSFEICRYMCRPKFLFDRAEQPLNLNSGKFPFTIHCVPLVYLRGYIATRPVKWKQKTVKVSGSLLFYKINWWIERVKGVAQLGRKHLSVDCPTTHGPVLSIRLCGQLYTMFYIQGFVDVV